MSDDELPVCRRHGHAHFLAHDVIVRRTRQPCAVSISGKLCARRDGAVDGSTGSGCCSDPVLGLDRRRDCWSTSVHEFGGGRPTLVDRPWYIGWATLRDRGEPVVFLEGGEEGGVVRGTAASSSP